MNAALLLLAWAAGAPLASAWVNLRKGGKEMTFQTNVQVGDWKFASKLEEQELYITGNMSVGKNASLMKISGNAHTAGRLFTEYGSVSNQVVTPETRSGGELTYRTGPGGKLTFEPGFLGQMVVGSNIYVRGDYSLVVIFSGSVRMRW